jgi:glucose/arabinose dehydrogenase
MAWNLLRPRRASVGRPTYKHPPIRPCLEQLERRDLPSTALPPGFTETNVVSGLSNPTNMEFAPDGRLFVLEQGGAVKLVHADGSTFTALTLNVDSAGERGLLGIAFDPNYASDHFVYLYYTNPNAGGTATGVHNQLSRFTVNDADPQHPTFGSETPILDLNNLSGATNHNGGGIHFGADGMLYAGVGENANGSNAQTLNNLLGKLLRINVGGYVGVRDDTTVGHIIPTDNPFVGTASGINQLIYALGLRNPFTFAVQPGTGQIFINDVGQDTWEEIDQAVAGANYGWPFSEGFRQPGDQNTTIGTYHDPLLAYNHTGGPARGGAAIVGSVFYDPATVQFPAQYVGKYFYEDLSAGWIRVFDPAHPGSLATPDTSSGFATADVGNTVALKVDAVGNLYYLSRTAGAVERISFQAPVVQPSSLTVSQGQSATFTVAPAGATPLTYQWQHLVKGTWTDVGPNAATFTLSSAAQPDAGSYRVLVSNSLGQATSTTATLTVTVTNPSSLAIDAGGGAAGSYVADTDFTGGSTGQVTSTIDVSQVAHPAPLAVYQTWRFGNFTYTIPNLTPGASYTVRLDFSENVATAAHQRAFNVAINGGMVLSKFDVFAAAGGEFKALERDFAATADSQGRITVTFTGVVGSALVNGITVSSVSSLLAPKIASITAGNGSVSLSWTSIAGATGYLVHFGASAYSDLAGSPLVVGNVTSATVTGLTNGQTYFFWLQATNGSAVSPNSGTRTAQPTGGRSHVRKALPTDPDDGTGSAVVDGSVR